MAATKTGRPTRPLAHAELQILAPQTRLAGSDFVFPSDRDENVFYQGTKRYRAKAIKLANLPGFTPYTLRHTIGPAAVSSGEALVMSGVLLGHASHQAASIYSHMHQDPARRAADRVVGPIATALGLQNGAEILKTASACGARLQLSHKRCRPAKRAVVGIGSRPQSNECAPRRGPDEAHRCCPE